MNIADAILFKYPNASPIDDFHVLDHNDGTGQQIAFWNVKDSKGVVVPQPSSSDLSNWYLSALKVEKKAELSKKCYDMIVGGFTSSALGTAHTYPSDEEAQRNFNTIMNRFAIDSTFTSVNFKTIDSEYQVHTKTQFIQVFTDGHNYGAQQIAKLNNLKLQIDEASTVDAVNAITW